MRRQTATQRRASEVTRRISKVDEAVLGMIAAGHALHEVCSESQRIAWLGQHDSMRRANCTPREDTADVLLSQGLIYKTHSFHGPEGAAYACTEKGLAAAQGAIETHA